MISIFKLELPLQKSLPKAWFFSLKCFDSSARPPTPHRVQYVQWIDLRENLQETHKETMKHQETMVFTIQYTGLM